MPTRCKVYCSNTGESIGSARQEDGSYKPGKLFNATFFPVVSGSEENKTFFSATPTGKIELSTLTGKFEAGKEYYLDITEA